MLTAESVLWRVVQSCFCKYSLILSFGTVEQDLNLYVKIVKQTNKRDWAILGIWVMLHFPFLGGLKSVHCSFVGRNKVNYFLVFHQGRDKE